MDRIEPIKINPPLSRNQAEIREMTLGRFVRWIWDMVAIGGW
jgi:hypothetical protein